MKSKHEVERGAAEERAKTPLTETETRASQRPPGRGDQKPTDQEARSQQPVRPDEVEDEQGGHA